MVITNNTGLPEPIVKACMLTEEVEGLRVTSLLEGVRALILKQRHWDEIEMDAADMIWLIYGTAVHQILEMTKEEDDEFREERLSMKISNTTLTGKSDLFKNKVITDYKTTSVYKTLFGETEDWEKQLKLYAMLWRDAGFEVNGGEIVGLMKDHSKPRARREKDYPKYPVKVYRWNFTDKDLDDIKAWATERIKLIESLKDVPDNKLPMCTPEERWVRDTTWAIKKQGVKKAKKVCSSKAEAEKELHNWPGCYIEERPGEDKKCMDYCMASQFCPHAMKLKGETH